MLSLVPPVGSRIRLEAADAAPFAHRSDVRLYASGTAALAAALRAAAGREVACDEVVLPAYGCPALVAAALYAGMRPVLVDLAPGSPFPSVSSVRQRIGSRSVCIHVNFLGLPPPGSLIEHARFSNPLNHVYDCCQGWPIDGVCPDWAGAAVVSFGRGKPITLGSGGAVFLNGALNEIATLAPEPLTKPRTSLGFMLRSVLYNTVLAPRAFYWVDKVPGLHIGETRFQKLESLQAMCAQARKHLAANIAAYERSERWSIGQVRASIGDRSLGSFRYLNGFWDCAPDTRLLRLPLLAESKAKRELAVLQLRRAGFAATAMYRAPLWTFAGLEFLKRFEDECPNATDFADRLLTVPLHSGVSDRALENVMTRLASL